MIQGCAKLILIGLLVLLFACILSCALCKECADRIRERREYQYEWWDHNMALEGQYRALLHHTPAIARPLEEA